MTTIENTTPKTNGLEMMTVCSGVWIYTFILLEFLSFKCGDLGSVTGTNTDVWCIIKVLLRRLYLLTAICVVHISFFQET